MKKETLEKKIRIAMLDAGLNQKKLAEILGVKPPQISQWVKGERNPSITSLKKLAVATKKPLGFFLDESVANIVGDNNSGKVHQQNHINMSDIKKDEKILILEKENAYLKGKIEVLEKIGRNIKNKKE
ncbi:MAG: helix-turn-helix transcriptional regulator [Elusimicrobiota bacterium]|jgi:transcriptional regulator with XRE-family HTH domain|nr:helix-turn-helix transcriptional regulator [Elusimicrobiota bacterium]